MEYVMTLESYMIDDSTTDSAMESFRDKALEIFNKVRAAIRKFVDWIKSKIFRRKATTKKKSDSPDDVKMADPFGDAYVKDGAAQERLNSDAQEHVAVTVHTLTQFIGNASNAINTYSNALLNPTSMQTPTGADEIATLNDIVDELNEYANERMSEFEDKFSEASLADIGNTIQKQMKDLINNLNKLDRTLAFIVRSYQTAISVPQVQETGNQIAAKISQLVSIVQRSLSYYEKKI